MKKMITQSWLLLLTCLIHHYSYNSMQKPKQQDMITTLQAMKRPRLENFATQKPEKKDIVPVLQAMKRPRVSGENIVHERPTKRQKIATKILDDNQKPHSCTICSKSFAKKHLLTNHIRTHTDERPYKCTECEKTFIRSGNLTNHMRTHTGEKPYTCKVCQRSFSHTGNLTRHMVTHR